jgi:hypothetical protein
MSEMKEELPMAQPLVDEGWISLQEASRKYRQARASLYLWEKKGLLKLKRFRVGKPSVFVNEKELTSLLHGRDNRENDRTSLNTDALKGIWDNEDDARHDSIDWRTGKNVAP